MALTCSFRHHSQEEPIELMGNVKQVLPGACFASLCPTATRCSPTSPARCADRIRITIGDRVNVDVALRPRQGAHHVPAPVDLTLLVVVLVLVLDFPRTSTTTRRRKKSIFIRVHPSLPIPAHENPFPRRGAAPTGSMYSHRGQRQTLLSNAACSRATARKPPGAILFSRSTRGRLTPSSEPRAP